MPLYLRIAILTALLYIGSLTTVFSQSEPVRITGQILDAKSGNPMPYVTVAIGSMKSDKNSTGTTTDNQGKFRIRTDSTNIFIEISFLDY